MKLTDSTILITGGSSGIGYELAKLLANQNNKVLICSRSKEKLEAAKVNCKDLITFRCDISQPNDRKNLVEWVQSTYPACNMLINNAAIVNNTDFAADNNMLEKIDQEVHTNLTAPIALCKLFLPLLEVNSNPQIVNVTSGLVYAPKAAYPVYNATKAGIHAFTKVLRHQLINSPIKIREVLMTVVDTPFHNSKAPKKAIGAVDAARKMLDGLETNKAEIKIGTVKMLYFISRISPTLAFRIINSLES